jgi:hypothetical protein
VRLEGIGEQQIDSNALTEPSALKLEKWASDVSEGLKSALGDRKAPPGFEPGMKVLQTSALPLGYGARKQ